ncbi:MAG TPA: 4-(cytidine 5'-diphospho)-2-C-methyl-D-erythritol kinase [Vicinamibacterales bacterium]|jgi:4-diphosphocytidyl-2-C-methyl-D-erythritol kinase|nr:4-(cytidine 5'-diphospho)-2-C-methyl-D-erythritol kinase [Vicinamibacterales bacterium]
MRADPNTRARSKARAVSVTAFAKINLTLHVKGVRADGYHELRTRFQSLAIHDTLVFRERPGPFKIECDDPAIPTDRANLVWRAADRVWEAAGRRGEVSGVAVTIEKGIPVEAGLGGGSTDAAAALRALTGLWRVRIAPARLQRIAASLGADVPFFLIGGTAVGVNRGDKLIPERGARASVVLVQPAFGVSTAAAYGWWDADHEAGLDVSSRDEWRNDLERAVARRHPEIAEIAAALRQRGASYAAMSGSGSAVFGLFESPSRASAAARTLSSISGTPLKTLVTRTTNRTEYTRGSRPRFVRGAV